MQLNCSASKEDVGCVSRQSPPYTWWGGTPCHAPGLQKTPNDQQEISKTSFLDKNCELNTMRAADCWGVNALIQSYCFKISGAEPHRNYQERSTRKYKVEYLLSWKPGSQHPKADKWATGRGPSSSMVTASCWDDAPPRHMIAALGTSPSTGREGLVLLPMSEPLPAAAGNGPTFQLAPF